MNYVDYALAISASEEVLNWCKTVLAAKLKRKHLDQGEVEHVIDFLVSDAAPQRLKRMSYDQAKLASEKWVKANMKKGRNLVDGPDDLKTIHDFLDGSKIVQLFTKKALEREGFFMAHCVGGYNPETSTIYSYRDKNNSPHATFEVNRNGDQIVQIKGKGNGNIHPRYINPILDFLRSINISIRPNDMKNLGYIHVPASAVELLDMFVDEKGNPPAYKVLFGEKYLYAS